MNMKRTGTPNPSNGRQDAFEQALELAHERGRQRQRVMFGAWVGATAIALVATLTLLEGCSGGDSSKLASSLSDNGTSPQQQQAVVASTEALSTTQPLTHAEPVEDPEGLRAVPPDVIAAVSDTFVTAGQPIEVKVEGTSDITEMALSDGRGDALPMVRDSNGSVWRVNYRVPLRPRTDRLGLAVTAKNGSNRWRRVWLFLNVDSGKQQVETETPDESPNEPQ
jgi:hypothetical protein